MNRLRNTIRVCFATISVLTIIAALAPQVIAQEGHDEHDPFQGVTIEALSSIEPPQLPGYAMVLLRITLEPGAEIPAHGHPGAVALTIESGTFASEFTRGSGQVTRAAAAGGEPQTEEASAGGEIVLEAGDALAYDGDQAAHTMRNAGDVPVVLLISALLSSDQEGFLFEQGH